jgi:hypothetical protein
MSKYIPTKAGVDESDFTTPLDIQNTTIGNIINLYIKDRYSGNLNVPTNAIGKIRKVITNPKDFEYSQKSELETLNNENYVPIRYKVEILDDGTGIVPPSTPTIPEDPNSNFYDIAIDALDDYSVSPNYQGSLSEDVIVHVDRKQRIILYAKDPKLNTSVPPVDVSGSKPSNSFQNSNNSPTKISDVQNSEPPKPPPPAWAKPLNTNKITSKYGARIDPVTHQPAGHNGIDFGVPEGTPIYAPGDGVVTVSNINDLNGNYMLFSTELNHIAYTFGFAHMSKRFFKNNDKVTRGTVLGLSGNTGKSTGPHVHMTLRVNGGFVDPMSVREFRDLFSTNQGANLNTNPPQDK